MPERDTAGWDILAIIRDRRSFQQVGPILMGRNYGHVERQFSELVTREGSLLARWPDDFELCQVGRMDSGTFNLVEDFQIITTARHCIKPEGVPLSVGGENA